MPQCPCDVYSHRHTSAISTKLSSARFALNRRNPCCTMPASSHAPVAASSFSAGSPNSSSPPTPSAALRSASRSASSSDRLNTPGIDPIGRRTPSPGTRNSGEISCPGSSRVSRTRLRIASVRRIRRIRTTPVPIPPVYGRTLVVISSHSSADARGASTYHVCTPSAAPSAARETLAFTPHLP